MDFTNKNVYITGGSSGIGLSLGKLLASKGANVLIFSRSEEKLQSATNEIENHKVLESQKIASHPLDISDSEKVKQVLERSIVEFGIPDILINCAGRAHPRHFEEISVEQFDETININLKGIWYTIAALVPAMKEKGGYIVNVSSMAGFVGVFGYTDYCASKFGIIGLSEALKSELKKYKIDVSVLCPPDTDTPGFATENLTKPEETKAISENAKLMHPDDIAKELVKGMQKRKFMIVPGFEGKLTYYAKRFVPGIVDYFMERDIKKVNKK